MKNQIFIRKQPQELKRIKSCKKSGGAVAISYGKQPNNQNNYYFQKQKQTMLQNTCWNSFSGNRVHAEITAGSQFGIIRENQQKTSVSNNGQTAPLWTSLPKQAGGLEGSVCGLAG